MLLSTRHPLNFPFSFDHFEFRPCASRGSGPVLGEAKWKLLLQPGAGGRGKMGKGEGGVGAVEGTEAQGTAREK